MASDGCLCRPSVSFSVKREERLESGLSRSRVVSPEMGVDKEAQQGLLRGVELAVQTGCKHRVPGMCSVSAPPLSSDQPAPPRLSSTLFRQTLIKHQLYAGHPARHWG